MLVVTSLVVIYYGKQYAAPKLKVYWTEMTLSSVKVKAASLLL